MRRFRGRLECRGEDLERALDIVLAVREGHVELLRGLDDAALEQGTGEGRVTIAVCGEGGAVVVDRLFGEVDLEHRRLARHLRGEAGLARRLGESGLYPTARGEQARVGARPPQ